MSNKKVHEEREKIKKLLEESLPSGSGFDYDWKIENKKGMFHCKSSYHHMNEVGMYDRVIDFTLKMPEHHIMDFQTVFHVDASTRQFIEQDDFKSYLEDTVSAHLSEKEDAFHRCEKNLLELHGKYSR